MIHIVGLGGVGFWLTAALASSIPTEQLTCWDDDTLAGGTGATRLPWGPSTTKKVDLLRGYLSMVHGAPTPPRTHARKFSGILEVEKDDLVVDCTDMPLPERSRMWSRVRNKGARLLRVSYDGRGSIVVVASGLPLSSPPEGGYTTVPTLALSFAAGGLGAEAVRRYLANPVPFFNLSISVEEAMQCSPSQ